MIASSSGAHSWPGGCVAGLVLEQNHAAHQTLTSARRGTVSQKKLTDVDVTLETGWP
jgi:hypothetical protein